MENNKFRVYYRDSAYNTTDKIYNILRPMGIYIKCIGDGDNYFEYEITKNNGEVEYQWVTIIDKDYDTYPNEGYNVLVSDGTHYDVAYYIMSSEYNWRKVNVLEDDANLFTSFVPTKWKYLTK